ncbi:MAG: hypothetical protein N4A45_04320 [Flavobacteriales bacterium]|jgi:hypothetical protein|nr:hypothetical protein [Flavobacteriales bacterium]
MYSRYLKKQIDSKLNKGKAIILIEISYNCISNSIVIKVDFPIGLDFDRENFRDFVIAQ